ncbi:Ankyrin repeat domain-containing protein 1 [Hondaea fermentalgiana]|uniref:Ankyrin repeat domain-containing protein 1 n=1 Tax=Hondaea fermentalgiana TaxID=2315210 RepID=A0A2R5G9X3_9STRA|nr:Ankyrin repeat domain-containing protein 1 [Hondaea fermentalgiana]|eukprot:GBG24464.1 Ankyrin repeat domain-containing protein 1 [Hondaea fermentalgiana]
MGNGVSDMCCRLRSAAQKGKKEECVQFLKEGAPVTCQDNLYKSTALHEACRYGHHEVACLLIKYHADVNALDCIGHTPLFSAAKGGYNSIVNLLIERGADVNIVSHKGKTALHSAMENGHKVVTLLLLEAGAKLDARDCEGRTPPQLAAQSGTLQALVTCKLVLENSQSSKTVDSIIDVGDPRIPARARVLLHAWQVAAKIGKAFPVPKTSAFEAESDEPLRAFFNSLKMNMGAVDDDSHKVI